MILYDCFKEHATFKKATDGSAGFDLSTTEVVTLSDKFPATVGLGVRVNIPKGHVGLLTLRSGISSDVQTLTTPGIIDSDYRGELKMRLQSRYGPVKLEQGQRIAQLVVVPIHTMAAVPCEINEKETDRGAGGFGSTGK